MKRSILLVLLGIFLMGCSTVPIPTAAPTINPNVAPTQARTAVPTSTPTLAPTDTPTVAPTFTTTPTAKATGSPTVRPSATRAAIPTAGTMTIKLFFVALNDNGKSGKKIGCEDSIVGVNRVIPQTSAPLTAALKELLSIRDQYYGQSGLYNTLYKSTLKLDGVSIVNAKAIINLSGNFGLSGVCDNPRVKAQIEETALQFSTVRDVAIFIGGVPIEKALSEK